MFAQELRHLARLSISFSQFDTFGGVLSLQSLLKEVLSSWGGALVKLKEFTNCN